MGRTVKVQIGEIKKKNWHVGFDMENLDYAIEKLKGIIDDTITSQRDRISAIELLCQLEGYLEEKE